MASKQYVPLIQRPKSSPTAQLVPDWRVPFAPWHLVPEDLRISGLDYATELAAKRYQESKFQNKVEYASFLDEAFLHKPRQLLQGDFTYTLPEIRKEYQYLASSPNAARDLELDLHHELEHDNHFKEIVSGAKIVNLEFPYSQCYAGWQFGQFAGQLGDGRVTNLFELQGKRKYQLQLKGSGKTPYSRFADGKAVLRSSVREFIISEYLNAIGIPTSRSLSITAFPKTYAQRTGAETCAVVTRFAESWVRIGNFDLYKWRGQGLEQFTDHCIDHVFEGKLTQLEPGSTKYQDFFLEVSLRNAKTTAMCQVYGFLNGVLNTDNTSILGLCIDFGPFAIMDKFEPNYTPNSEDYMNRYGYDNVPSTMWWNLQTLAHDLGLLLEDGTVEKVSKRYETQFLETYLQVFSKRLGLKTVREDDNEKLISPMLQMLWNTQINYNRFFAILNQVTFFDDKIAGDPRDGTDYSSIARLFIPDKFENSKGLSTEDVAQDIEKFLRTFHDRLIDENNLDDKERLSISSPFNPLFVPSNWIIEEVVDNLKYDKDVKSLEKLIAMISSPYSKESWGSDLKDTENKWIDNGAYDKSRYMLQCSCSS